jgi:hypothetical protein
MSKNANPPTVSITKISIKYAAHLMATMAKKCAECVIYKADCDNDIRILCAETILK